MDFGGPPRSRRTRGRGNRAEKCDRAARAAGTRPRLIRDRPAWYHFGFSGFSSWRGWVRLMSTPVIFRFHHPSSSVTSFSCIPEFPTECPERVTPSPRAYISRRHSAIRTTSLQESKEEKKKVRLPLSFIAAVLQQPRTTPLRPSSVSRRCPDLDDRSHFFRPPRVTHLAGRARPWSAKRMGPTHGSPVDVDSPIDGTPMTRSS